MKRIQCLWAACAATLCAAFFGPAALAAPRPATAFQYSTLPALGTGLYDGGLTFGELLKHGNFGLGTLNALDGELIILDGKAYQATPGGPVNVVDKATTTPFAVVTNFKADQSIPVTEPLDLPALQKKITAALPTLNTTYAIQVTGTFERVKVRSVHAQKKPYPGLLEVTKTQTVTEWNDVQGTLVGFRYPPFLGGVNLPDLHFHFLTDDRKLGGHVLDLKLAAGSIKIQQIRDIQIQLPGNAEFDKTNLSVDASAAFKAAEAAGGK